MTMFGSQQSELSAGNIIIWKFRQCVCQLVVSRRETAHRYCRLRHLIGASNGGFGGCAGGCQLLDGDGEVQDDACCQSQQEDHLARCQVCELWTFFTVGITNYSISMIGERESTRGHCLKLVKVRCTRDSRQHFFSKAYDTRTRNSYEKLMRVNSREKLVRVSYRLAARYFSREFLASNRACSISCKFLVSLSWA